MAVEQVMATTERPAVSSLYLELVERYRGTAAARGLTTREFEAAIAVTVLRSPGVAAAALGVTVNTLNEHLRRGRARVHCETTNAVIYAVTDGDFGCPDRLPASRNRARGARPVTGSSVSSE